jgi:hypothetical protein
VIMLHPLGHQRTGIPEPTAAGPMYKQQHTAMTQSAVCTTDITSHPPKYEYLRKARVSISCNLRATADIHIHVLRTLRLGT